MTVWLAFLEDRGKIECLKKFCFEQMFWGENRPFLSVITRSPNLPAKQNIFSTTLYISDRFFIFSGFYFRRIKKILQPRSQSSSGKY